jgi:hypothetical protein
MPCQISQYSTDDGACTRRHIGEFFRKDILHIQESAARMTKHNRTSIESEIVDQKVWKYVQDDFQRAGVQERVRQTFQSSYPMQVIRPFGTWPRTAGKTPLKFARDRINAT